MRTSSRILNLRHKRNLRQARSPLGRVGLGCSGVVGVLLILVIFLILSGYISLTRDLPSLQTLPDLLTPPDGALLQPTRLYDHTNTHVILTLEDLGAAGREYIAFESLPPSLVDAYLVVFEPSFWDSPGYTLQGLWNGEIPKNTNQPIAQRLVSDLLLWDEAPSLRRSLRERLLAAQLVARYGRQQVLEWSLNTTQFGPLIYGIDAAALTFFGKSATELNLGEAAFLAAAAQTPEANALEVPQVVFERQRTVLQDLLLQGKVSAEEAAYASFEDYALRDPMPAMNLAPAFTNLVLEQLSAYVPLERIQRGGLRVTTTLDYDLQVQALCTANTLLSRLKGEADNPIAIDGQPCEAARLLPTLALNNQPDGSGLQANVVILEPATGNILAMVGELTAGLDPAHQPGHPAGSLLTPFIYLTGFTRGLGPASLVWDIPPSQTETLNNQIRISLADYHGPVRLRTALANDYLEPARKIIQQLGPDTIMRLSGGLGLDSLQGSVSADETGFDLPLVLLDVAHAYSIFANQGILAGQPYDS